MSHLVCVQSVRENKTSDSKLSQHRQSFNCSSSHYFLFNVVVTVSFLNLIAYYACKVLKKSLCEVYVTFDPKVINDRKKTEQRISNFC